MFSRRLWRRVSRNFNHGHRVNAEKTGRRCELRAKGICHKSPRTYFDNVIGWGRVKGRDYDDIS
jgi:hypothetical protein